MRYRFRATLAALLCAALLSETAPQPPAVAAPIARPVSTPTTTPSALPTAPAVQHRAPKSTSARRPFAALDPKTIRASVTADVLRASGIKAAGPPMLGPHEIDQPIRAAQERRRRLQSAASVRPPARKSLSTTRTAMGVVGTDYGAGTGINPWWRYQEQNVPGAGHVMVNIGTGNYIVQADDMSIPHKGIALAFRRTYNSQSGHDVAGRDGAQPSLYGNGWTSTWDAHLTGDGTHTLSVWDIDGARYDYTIASDGITWNAPAGQHATLTSDGACGVLWTKKSGTSYYFYSTVPVATCPSWSQNAGYAGRVYQIVGRNRNTTLSFSYGWDNGNTGAGGKIAVITAYTESGLQATVPMADFNGHRLAYGLSIPDGTSVYYGYDNSGNLTSVGSPPNNGGTAMRYETYGYATSSNGAGYLSWAASPRWNGSSSADGAYLYFGAEPRGNTNLLIGIGHMGYINPPIVDGYSTGVLQPGAASGLQQFLLEYYDLAATNETYSDTDGHMASWTTDGSGRPVQTNECTASTNQGQQCTGTWLTTTEAWDLSNNLISTVEPRGNASGANPQAYETDYAYDANGNTVAAAQPAVPVSTPGGPATFRPTQLFDYDAHDNLIAYCDQRASHPRGDWTASGPPTAGGPDALCANNGASAHAAFTYPLNPAPPYEPFGRLTSIRTPLGYTSTIAYDPNLQGGVDYGLPTSVTGQYIAQSDGGRTPFQSLRYDVHGRLVCAVAAGADPTASTGDATTTTVLTYDGAGRVTAIGDPDDSTLTSTACSKQPGIAGSSIVSRTTYFPDGSVATTQSASEAAAGVSTQFAYDLDSDTTTETHHYTSTPGTTTKWYDGADRLVEVQQPTDPLDYYKFAWTTRYLYDLTQGGTVSVATSPQYQAYGGLYKTQELLPAGVPNPQWNEPGSAAGASTGTTSPTWQDTAGTAFDGMDRPVTQYRNTGSSLMPVTTAYDASGAFGLLSQKCNARSECQSFAYDARGAKTQATFNVPSSPTQTFGYDENGRLASATNAVGTLVDSYDADSRKTTRTETAGTQTATIAYSYYGDGQRSSLSINTASQYLPNELAYTYTPSGLVRSISIAGASAFGFTYTGGRRLTSRSDNTGQPATTFTYTNSGSSPTSIGLVQSMSAPGFYETGMTYNSAARQLTGNLYVWKDTGFFPGPAVYNGYTSRDELANGSSLFANGVQIPVSASNVSPKTALYQFNAFQSYPVQSNSANTCGQRCVENDSNWAYTYDSVGRQQTSAYLNPDSGTTYSNAKSYDAEDHLLSQALPWIPNGKTAYAQSLGYRWGPVGHPFQIGSTSAVLATNPQPTDFQYDSLFWDDDDLLFTTNAAGQIDDLKIADFADYVPGASTPLSVLERDVSGQIQGCHSNGNKNMAQSGPYQNIAFICTGLASSFVSPKFGINTTAAGRGGILLVQKDDGFSDGQNTFQGVRAYDPQAGVWTTPDAYRGNVHDPMSLKPYVWNRNNPYIYSDPSGYCPDACVVEGGAIVGGTELVIGGSFVIAAALSMSGRHDAANAVSGFASKLQGKINDAVQGVAHAVGSALKQKDGKQQWRRLGPGEVRRLQGDVHPHELKPGGSKEDVFVDRDGNLGVGNKDGSGEVEPLGINLNDQPKAGNKRKK